MPFNAKKLPLSCARVARGNYKESADRSPGRISSAQQVNELRGLANSQEPTEMQMRREWREKGNALSKGRTNRRRKTEGTLTKKGTSKKKDYIAVHRRDHEIPEIKRLFTGRRAELEIVETELHGDQGDRAWSESRKSWDYRSSGREIATGEREGKCFNVPLQSRALVNSVGTSGE